MAAANTSDRVISLGADLPAIPERLLLAHANGSVLFVVGAGASLPSGLPDFRRLALAVYEKLDPPTHRILALPPDKAARALRRASTLTPAQIAGARRFLQGDYDMTLGMLERRVDRVASATSQVRRTVADLLGARTIRSAPIHRSLMRLADRGGVVTIATTNFDRLLEAASHTRATSHALGGMPRPGRGTDFAGVFHIHGILSKTGASELVLSDHDFGEYYLRRRIIPDFIYEAARLYHIVLVGYSANDPPMRYLLNSVAADGTRFEDLKERFTFYGSDAFDDAMLEDWRARGITPIPYDSADGHSALAGALKRWANLFADGADTKAKDRELRRVVRARHAAAPDGDRDLFDHIFRRADQGERTRLSALVAAAGADPDWLSAIIRVGTEPRAR